MKKLLLLILIASKLSAQNHGSHPLPVYLDLQSSVSAISMVMVHDVVNPPAASRYYAYCMLGAYEIVSKNNSSIPSLSGIIKDYKSLPVSGKNKYDYRIAAAYCILETGRLMLPSGYMLEEDLEKFARLLKDNNVNAQLAEQSIATGKEFANAIIAFSKTDGYNRLSARMRYAPLKGDGYWYPTPPAYIEAVEPNWKTVRTMLIDSCNQFIPVPPAKYSKDTSTSFYKLAKEVYDVSKNPVKEHLVMASFWDCNPFAVTTSGHMSIGYKKISPGGHWMNIAGIAAKKAALNFDHSVLLLTLESVTLVDAFIVCWEEKYRSNRIRPETFINKNIDIRWQPLLQTPPFPEYTSGHSVISTASAELLTYLLGDNFSYIDNSEEPFEIPARSFKSFRQAAAEAAISRLYGGIHYRDAIENGQQQGRDVANFIIRKIKSSGIKPMF